jgi:hypothetical protein
LELSTACPGRRFSYPKIVQKSTFWKWVSRFGSKKCPAGIKILRKEKAALAISDFDLGENELDGMSLAEQLFIG